MLVGDRGVKGKCGGFLSRGHRQIQRAAPAELASSGEGGSAVISTNREDLVRLLLWGSSSRGW